MNPKNPIVKKDVIDAIAALKSKGEKVTHQSIRTAIGRGSFSTIGAFLREIEAEASSVEDSAAAKEAQTAIWALAMSAATKAVEDRVAGCQARIDELLSETARLEECDSELAAQVVEAHHKRDEAAHSLALMTEQLSAQRTAHAAVETKFASLEVRQATADVRYAELAEKHAGVVAELSEAIAKRHELEIEVIKSQAAHAEAARLSDLLQRELAERRSQVASMEEKLVTMQAASDRLLKDATDRYDALLARNETERREFTAALAKANDGLLAARVEGATTETKLAAALATIAGLEAKISAPKNV
jgi:chromosome segregation ATPase